MSDIEAAVLERRTDGSPGGLGSYKFLVVPSPGDFVAIPGPSSMDMNMWRVEYVEHHPVAVNAPRSARPDPTITIVVTHWATEWVE